MNPITEPFFSLLWAGAATTRSGGKEPVELNPGDVVYVVPETKHWHGAAPDSDFAHIAIMDVVDGASNEWLEPVEAEYDALRCIDEAAKSM